MHAGTWHQCGYNSQKFVVEQLEHDNGRGVVLSSKDLAFENWKPYSEQYRDLGAEVILDPQFYVPTASHGKLNSYPSFSHRAPITSLLKLPEKAIGAISKAIEIENSGLSTNAVIAPAIPYEAARSDIADTNKKLFGAAKAAGDALGVPTYATVVLSRSLTADKTVAQALSDATSLNADGWYFAFEFDPERLPSNESAIDRYCLAALTLATTFKPVLHACSGPLGLLAPGVGATGVGIGGAQNLWGFSRARFEAPDGSGGGGAAPARFFSTALWGTIVQPDETVQIKPPYISQIMTHSPFSEAVKANAATTWSKWDANKHLVYLIGQVVDGLCAQQSAKKAMGSAVKRLSAATKLFASIEKDIVLKDRTSSYQSVWLASANRALVERSDEYDLLDLL